MCIRDRAHLALGQAEALRPELFPLGDELLPLHVLGGAAALEVLDHLGEGGGAWALGVEPWPEAAGLCPGREVRQHGGVNLARRLALEALLRQALE
eukprot:9449481-Alexandrium_andersonii.AAC.1